VHTLARAATTVALMAVPLLAGCDPAKGVGSSPADAASSSVMVIDDAGRSVELDAPARRVVSLVPAVTELVLALDAGERLVGRTRYDADPRIRHLPSVGGGLDPSLEALLGLRPDLVVAWDAHDGRGLRDRLDEAGVAVLAIRVEDTTGVYRSIGQMGTLLGTPREAERLAGDLRAELAAVRASLPEGPRPSVLFVMGTEAPRTPGPRTFVAQLVEVAGGRIAFDDLAQDWPQISLEEIVRRQPDLVLVPAGDGRTGAADRLRELPGWRDLRAVREGRVREVNADLVSRPGPYMGEAARLLRDAIHGGP
jgi:iron complex transport system substrate-binding protein